MRTDNARVIRLADYAAPSWKIEKVSLRFELDASCTKVHSHMTLTHHGGPQELVLHGEQLELLSVKINGEDQPLEQLRCTDEQLCLELPGKKAEVEIVNLISPEKNTALEGLYTSANFLLTQCEAEGFRKITYFQDRPDVMAEFHVRLEADKAQYPVLLSNGNPGERGELAGGLHFAEWHDPHPKPSYLFALVAGDLGHIHQRYTTGQGREVDLYIWAEHRNMDQCDFAMSSLVNAMKWDEERFGLYYDLDVYNVVATDDFNMGAMENKGLNVFNSRFVLARPDTATDDDYLGIESVIGHEYFHNWTGNRVTCRDWFQLSLKEGLTVFRDQEFSSDLQSRAVERIGNVRVLRSAQFPEDAGPMRHPIRPSQYEEISNFYTATVYIKGSEVVRMYHTLLGEEGFQKGMRLYFERHDGQAVTTEDFLAAMADANAVDLSQFQRWYDQPGTPTVQAQGEYDAETQTYRLTLRQQLPDGGDVTPQPLLIPVRVALLDRQGRAMPLLLNGQDLGTETVIELTAEEQIIEFEQVTSEPVPSLLRGFSAPVKLDMPTSAEDLAFRMAHDDDDFNRWEAAQQLGCQVIIDLQGAIRQGKPSSVDDTVTEAVARVLADQDADRGLRAEALVLPAESYLAEQVDEIDPDAISRARSQLQKHLAVNLRDQWLETYQAMAPSGDYRFQAEEIFRRRLRNVALDYIACGGDATLAALVSRQYREADNMTDQLAALRSMAMHGHRDADELLEDFYQRFEQQPLVVNKWLSLQAMRPGDGALERMQLLLEHPAFSLRNPNKVNALLGAFASGNRRAFHRKDGAGYVLIADQVLALDALNPQVAARLVSVFNPWRRFETVRQALMREQLERIQAHGELSRDVAEIVGKALRQN
jgi:aminopeptidase N